MVYNLTLLGNFMLRGPRGQSIAIASKKNRALLAILALSPGQQATRERLAGLLWSDRGEEQAHTSLRQALAVLRKELGERERSLLRTHDDVVTLVMDAITIDTISFEQLASAEDAASLRQAAHLYGGELLADSSVKDPGFDDWLAAERQRLADRVITVLEKLSAIETGPARIEIAKRLVDLDTLRESSHRALMLAYLEAGENGLAIKQYESCKRLLKEELGAEPSGKTQDLRLRIAEKTLAPASADIATLEPANVKTDSSRPSIAVLPFTNLGGDPAQDYFADGITEDIITELSRFRGLFVIGRNSTFVLAGKTLGLSAIAKELGVKFLLQGSFRRSGDQIRVTARLVEAESGRDTWAEHYDRKIEDIFAVQDEVVRTIVATFEGRLASLIANQSKRQIPSGIAAYECVLQARKLLEVYDFQSAEPLLRRAIAIDPRYAQAHGWLAMVYWVKFFHHFQDRDITESVAFAKAAVNFDPDDSIGHGQLGFAYLFARQFDLADIHSQKALRLNHSDMLSLSMRAHWLCRVGRAQDALDTLDQVILHDPYPPSWYWENRAVALVTLERFEEALAAIRHKQELFWWDHYNVAACCAGLGRLEDARDAVARLLDEFPEANIQSIMKGEPYKYPEDAEQFAHALRLAGVPEHPAISQND